MSKSVDQRFPRSGQTRKRILAEARRLFSTAGYERTTIRAVASAASIDPSLVMRYFDSKDGLFAAAVTFDLRFPDLTKVPKSNVGEALVQHFLSVWETKSSGEDLRALLRAAATNQAALKKVQALFRTQVGPGIVAVCHPTRSEEAVALTVAQMMGVAYTRYVLRLPPVTRLSHEVLVREVGAAIQRYMKG